LSRALEGVGDRDKPGRDEVSRSISPLSGCKIFPGQPCGENGNPRQQGRSGGRSTITFAGRRKHFAKTNFILSKFLS
jgi:hypothetical protein